MANPDIPAALVVLEAHLVAAGAALGDDILDVDRGLITGGRQLRYFWSGECPPPHMTGPDVLNGKMVGQRFTIAASWPLSDLTVEAVEVFDSEMQTLAGEIRTRLQGDNDLGNHIESLDLEYGEPTEVVISGARYAVMAWQLDLGYVEYPVAK